MSKIAEKSKTINSVGPVQRICKNPQLLIEQKVPTIQDERIHIQRTKQFESFANLSGVMPQTFAQK